MGRRYLWLLAALSTWGCVLFGPPSGLVAEATRRAAEEGTPPIPLPTDTARPTEFFTPTSRPSPTPQPTDTWTPEPGPGISHIRFCDVPCDQASARQVTVFPEGVREIFVAWDYEGMQRGMRYSREWTNRGEMWVHYDCVWEGPPSGTWNLRLYDLDGGLRSGEWIMTIVVEGEVVARASVAVAGDHPYWDPAGVRVCEDFD